MEWTLAFVIEVLILQMEKYDASKECKDKPQTGKKNICKDTTDKGLLSKTHTQRTLQTQQFFKNLT